MMMEGEEPTFIIVNTPSQRLTEALYTQDWNEAMNVLKTRECKKRPTVFSLRPAASSSASSIIRKHLGIALDIYAPSQQSEALNRSQPTSIVNERGLQAFLPPIHIACMNGAPRSTIEAIISKYTKACLLATDSRSRAPLHYAIEFMCHPKKPIKLRSNKKKMINWLKKGIKSKNISLMTMSRKDFMNRMKTIKMLAQTSPESLCHADNDGNTPIDILSVFILSVSDGRLDKQRAEICCTELRKVAIQNYRNKKMIYELKRGDSTINGSLVCVSGPSPTTRRALQPLSNLARSSVSALTPLSYSNHGSCTNTLESYD